MSRSAVFGSECVQALLEACENMNIFYNVPTPFEDGFASIFYGFVHLGEPQIYALRNDIIALSQQLNCKNSRDFPMPVYTKKDNGNCQQDFYNVMRTSSVAAVFWALGANEKHCKHLLGENYNYKHFFMFSALMRRYTPPSVKWNDGDRILTKEETIDELLVHPKEDFIKINEPHDEPNATSTASDEPSEASDIASDLKNHPNLTKGPDITLPTLKIKSYEGDSKLKGFCKKNYFEK